MEGGQESKRLRRGLWKGKQDSTNVTHNNTYIGYCMKKIFTFYVSVYNKRKYYFKFTVGKILTCTVPALIIKKSFNDKSDNKNFCITFIRIADVRVHLGELKDRADPK